VTNWRIDDILMVCRHIINMAKGETFHKDLLEDEMLAWMPMLPVRGLY